MKLRQAKKIVTNTERGDRNRYRRGTLMRADRCWYRNDLRGARKFMTGLRRYLGPLGFLEFRIESSLRVLEKRHAR